MADTAALSPPLRRLIAYLAGVLVADYAVEGVFDFDTGSRYPVSGYASAGDVKLTDDTDGATLGGRLPMLAAGDGTRVTVRFVDDDEFEGDAGGVTFHGRVMGRNIDLFDDTGGAQHTYCL